MEVIHLIEYLINNPKILWALISFITALILIISVLRFHFSKEYGDFNLVTLFSVDSTTNKPSDSKIRLNTAFIITSWAFVYLTMNDKLTEWFMLAFLGAWVTDRFLARWTRKNSSDEIDDDISDIDIREQQYMQKYYRGNDK